MLLGIADATRHYFAILASGVTFSAVAFARRFAPISFTLTFKVDLYLVISVEETSASAFDASSAILAHIWLEVFAECYTHGEYH